MLRVVCNCLVAAGKIELGTIESASLFKAAGALGAFDEVPVPPPRPESSVPFRKV
jgi:hypothetical protein